MNEKTISFKKISTTQSSTTNFTDLWGDFSLSKINAKAIISNAKRHKLPRLFYGCKACFENGRFMNLINEVRNIKPTKPVLVLFELLKFAIYFYLAN